jgi:hypothetical protein
MGTVQVQALITAVGAGTITVSVNGQPLTLPLPAGIQLPQSVVGQTITLTLNLTGAGPVAADDDDQADDNDQADNDDQGDDNDDQGDDDGGGNQGGGGGGDDGDD